MKKVLAVAAAVGILAAASFASAATIVGSKHDLSPTSNGTVKGQNSQICVYCHAPHGAATMYPLWNRINPTAVYKLYSGTGMQSRQFGTGFTDDSTSLFCMSCHDGSIQMDAIHNKGALTRNAGLGQAGSAGLAFTSQQVTGYPALADSSSGTGDLTLTHPINFPVATANNTQNDLWVGNTGAGSMGGGAGTALDQFPLFTTTNVSNGNQDAARATNRSLECGSCHAVHDSLNSPFLRFTMAGSKLCLGCHNK